MNPSDFNPNGVGQDNGHFIGLPFAEEDAKLVIISVPWDVTVSYRDGTANAPENILKASLQLDLEQSGIPEAWKMGIFVRPSDRRWGERNTELRNKSSQYIQFLEDGNDILQSPKMQAVLDEVNMACAELNDYVYDESIKLLELNKIPAVLGGEHSCPLGLIKALKEKHGEFAVLQIDAHMDLRNSYEDFKYSHASIFNNVLSKGYVSSLVQVGIRDYCEEEILFAKEKGVKTFFDDDLKSNFYQGVSWHNQCLQIIQSLPEKVYVSFDVDGLNPHLCPGTGTPVPGGLEFAEAIYLIRQLAESGREIIGFDLCEVGGESEWDANVAARILYNLCNWSGKSNKLI